MNCETYPTIVTPFNADGSIDYSSLEKLIQLFAQTECDGIFAVCKSSEAFYLSDEEKIELAQNTLNLCRANGLKCVISGHTQERLEDQIAFLREIEAMKPEAVVLISNRLARQDQDDEIAIRNLQTLCAAFSPNTTLGMYECPYPYKRDISPAIIQAMATDGRFRFIKDTCCRIDVIKERLGLIKNTGIGLYNANAATLLESLKAGAIGYSGVLLNLIPELFTMFCRAMQENNDLRAELISEQITASALIEYQSYPLNAKYILVQRGIFKNTTTREDVPAFQEHNRQEMDAFWTATTNAYYHLAPHATPQMIFPCDIAFNECHASTVLPLDNGRVLVSYFAGTREGADDVGIWLSVFDRGIWEKPRKIAKISQEAHWNPVLFMSGSDVRLVFKEGRSIKKWVSYTMASADGGEHWSEPKPYPQENAAGGPVRNKPIVLSSGDMLAPCSDETADTWLARVDRSTDGGATFDRFGRIPLNRTNPQSPNYLPGKGAIQPTLWESAPGHVHALLRTTGGMIYRSDSVDYGQTWCEAYQTSMPNNNSGIDLAQHDGTLYLAMNPTGSNWGKRTPMVLLRSTDNGSTFHLFRVLSDELLDDICQRRAEFSYPAVVAKHNQLYITYTHHRKSMDFVRIKL